MLLLVTLAFGVTAVAVHAVTVGAAAPAAAGVLLLAVFAVPTALADDLLPSWMLVAAAAGFGLLLFARPGPPAGRRQWRPGAGGAAIVAAAIVLALAAGVVAEGVGTAGRFPSSGGAGAGRGTEIGLSPFTALRGELQEATPTELFRVTGLPRPAYLRALTLSTYVPDTGWQLRRPGPGTPLTGELPGAGVPGDRASVRVENVGFRDYWLPVYGVPLGVSGLSADGWSFDPLSGTAYSTRPRQEQAWTQDALLPRTDGGLAAGRRRWRGGRGPHVPRHGRASTRAWRRWRGRSPRAHRPGSTVRSRSRSGSPGRARRSPTTCRRRRATATTPSSSS